MQAVCTEAGGAWRILGIIAFALGQAYNPDVVVP